MFWYQRRNTIYSVHVQRLNAEQQQFQINERKTIIARKGDARAALWAAVAGKLVGRPFVVCDTYRYTGTYFDVYRYHSQRNTFCQRVVELSLTLIQIEQAGPRIPCCWQ